MVRAKCVQQEYRWCVPRDLQRPLPCADGAGFSSLCRRVCICARNRSLVGAKASFDCCDGVPFKTAGARLFTCHSTIRLQWARGQTRVFSYNGGGVFCQRIGSTVLMPETAKHLQKDIRTMDSHSMCRELIMCFETLTHGVALAEGLSSP